ncbi:MAG: pyridoxal phosphate-dependent aminotransferase, partial [Acutalibacteraceae bacterium]
MWVKKCNFRNVVPYVPGEQPKDSTVIKLNTNENPYPPSPFVKKAMLEIDYDDLRKYPDPTCGDLVNEIARYHNVDRENIFTGVGSDDVLGMCFLTFFNSGKEILFPNITYAFYKVWAELFNIPYFTPALDENFNIVKEDYVGKECGGIVFPNPNAPTGIALRITDIEEIIKSNRDKVVIIDEAYVDFYGKSVLPFTNKYDNLIVVRTFSKSRSMAGMRIGYAVGNKELIKLLSDVKYSYNSYTLNLPSILGGVASLKDEGYFKETVGKIIETREKAKKRFSSLGFDFLDSQANFIFVKHRDIKGKKLFNALKENKIFVR